MSEYNIPVLVRGDLAIKKSWSNAAKSAPGTVRMARESSIGPRVVVDTENVYWEPHEYIPNPTPSQIAEEARKAGKEPVTTKPLVDPMTVNWPKSEFALGCEAVVKPEHIEKARSFGFDLSEPLKFSYDDGTECPEFVDRAGRKHYCKIERLVPLSKIREYEAAQSAQKGPMEPKQAIKKHKETIAAKALREAMDKVKADQERITAIRSLFALEEEKRQAREKIRDIDDQIATLSKKWLKGVGK